MMSGAGLWMGLGWLIMLAVVSLPIAAIALLAVGLVKTYRPPSK